MSFMSGLTAPAPLCDCKVLPDHVEDSAGEQREIGICLMFDSRYWSPQQSADCCLTPSGKGYPFPPQHDLCSSYDRENLF